MYTHVAGKHYYNQLVELYKANFMRTDGMCTGCPNRPINDVQARSFETISAIKSDDFQRVSKITVKQPRIEYRFLLRPVEREWTH